MQPHPHLIRALRAESVENIDPDNPSEYNPVPVLAELEQPTFFLGHLFEPFEQILPAEAWSLTIPDFCYAPECGNDTIYDFVTFVNYLGIPDSPVNKDTSTFTRQLDLQGNWFASLAQNMTIHAKFFKHSGNLSHCSPAGNGSSAIINSN
jgi:hypothetical protein